MPDRSKLEWRATTKNDVGISNQSALLIRYLHGRNVFRVKGNVKTCCSWVVKSLRRFLDVDSARFNPRFYESKLTTRQAENLEEVCDEFLALTSDEITENEASATPPQQQRLTSSVRAGPELVIETLEMLLDARFYSRMNQLVQWQGKSIQNTKNALLIERYNVLRSAMYVGLANEITSGEHSLINANHPYIREWHPELTLNKNTQPE